MPSKANILFPIETINREFDFRLYLAALTATENHRIFIGSDNAIAALAQNMKGGLYVGKNFRPTPLPEEDKNNKAYVALKERQIKVVWLDEEGGIFWGQEDEWRWTMQQSINPLKLSPSDQICTWGDTQRDFYRSLRPDFAENIQTTGHPRFDLYKPHYRDYYDADVRELQERLGDFVLINTNFHRAYTTRNLKKIFGKRAQMNPSGYDHGEAVERWHHLVHIFSDFIKLISRLRQELPELNFVIRPHPSEDMKFYKNIFEGIGNVHVLREGAVGPWLLACRAMIHDGCTTAVESHFCNTPIINYKPLADERFDCVLPNQFGMRCTNEVEALEYLQTLMKKPRENVPDASSTSPYEKIACETAALLVENFRRDSFPVLAETITVAAAQTLQDRGNPARGFSRNNRSASGLSILKRRKNSYAKEDSEGGITDKFYGFDNVNIAAKVQTVQKMLGKHINCAVISDELLCIEI